LSGASHVYLTQPPAYRACAALTPNPDNPRRHSDKQIAQIAASIDRFGFVVPIMCDDDGLIVAGAGR
jgi:ParB-like chromosome segregation protein Spo0J